MEAQKTIPIDVVKAFDKISIPSCPEETRNTRTYLNITKAM
jgi:hypothetical protein